MAAKPKKKLLNDKTQIAERLKTAREELALTQQQVADKARVSRSAVVHYEKGNVIPGGSELIGLAKALKITPNYILSGSEGFFDSSAQEHALASQEVDTAIRVARVGICMEALDREVAEALSALVMAMVKAKLPKSKYPGFIKALDALSETMVGFGPEFEVLVENKATEGAFDHLAESLTEKPRRKTKPKK
jgi:transcriptional regulator with XRE-family HTH domain